VEVDLRRGRLRIERHDGATRAWWSAGGARRSGQRWEWTSRGGLWTVVELVAGRPASWTARSRAPERRVGYGELRLVADRAPSRSLTVVEPDSSGRVAVEVRLLS
jgi:hypothetical protein